MTNNYFKLTGRLREGEYFFFDDKKEASVTHAFARAIAIRKNKERLSVFRRIIMLGTWSHLPTVIGAYEYE